MDKKLDIDAVIAEVRRVAAEQPDKCLEDGCVYFKWLDETNEIVPVCLVGQAIAPHLSPEEKAEVVASAWNDETINAAPARYLFPGDVDVSKLQWLRAAQYFQDNAGTWGEAVETADLTNPLN